MGGFGIVFVVFFILHLAVPLWIVLTRPKQIKQIYLVALVVTWVSPIVSAVIGGHLRQDGGTSFDYLITTVNLFFIVSTWLIAATSLIHTRFIDRP